MATFVMNAMAPDLLNFLIVPKQGTLTFGSLYEIKRENYEKYENKEN